MKNDNYKTLPPSLRTAQSEQEYAEAKVFNNLKPLKDEKPIKEWVYWRLVANRFPYDICFKTHDLLIPIRQVPLREELTKAELDELESIIRTFAETKYDMVFENTMRKRSIPAHFHMHLAAFYDTRAEMKV